MLGQRNTAALTISSEKQVAGEEAALYHMWTAPSLQGVHSDLI